MNADPTLLGERMATSSARHDPKRPLLRVGVMLDSWTVPAWTAKVLEEVEQSGAAQVSLVIMNQRKRRSLRERLRQIPAHGLYLLYHRLDRKIIRALLRIRQDAFDTIDVSALLAGKPVLEVTPIQKRVVQRFDETSLEQIRAAQLDVLLRFGFGILKGEILSAARYGIWSYHHGDNRQYRGGPPMFWEMYEGNPVAGVTLQQLTEKLDGGQVLYRSFAKTNELSLYLNRNRNYLKGASLVARRLRDLRAYGWDYIAGLDTFRENGEYARGLYRMPLNGTMLRFLGRLGLKILSRGFRKLFMEEQWFVAWRKRQAGFQIDSDPKDFRVLQPPPGRFFADPFVAKQSGRNYVFFEDYRYHHKRAVISFVELSAQGSPSEPRVAIAPDYHVSYPFVMEHDGQWYMIPESRAARRFDLWRATSFPEKWQLEKCLLGDINAGDPTWLAHDGRYWLFTNAAVEGASSSDELHVFISDEPFGPWRPHALNPIVSDVRGARPAGRVFYHDGALIRPGQDSALVYGHRVIFYRIHTLTETEYAETPIGTFEPSWFPGNIGTHTFNFGEDFEVVDGRVMRWRLPRLGRRP